MRYWDIKTHCYTYGLPRNGKDLKNKKKNILQQKWLATFSNTARACGESKEIIERRNKNANSFH